MRVDKPSFFCYKVNDMALRGKMENSHMMAKIMVWLGCIFVMFSLTVLVIALITQGKPLSDINTLKWIQLLQTIALFLLPSLMVAYLCSQTPCKWLQLDKKVDWTILLWAIGIMLVALPAINLLSHWNQQMAFPTWLSGLEAWMKNKEAEAEWLTKQFMSATTISGLLVNLFLMAVLPALSEEITFRGVLQRLLNSQHSSLNTQPILNHGLHGNYTEMHVLHLCGPPDSQLSTLISQHSTNKFSHGNPQKTCLKSVSSR